MNSMILYRRNYSRCPSVVDGLGVWFFFQRSFPYKLDGVFERWIVPLDCRCEVFVIGGVDKVFEGLLSDVPIQCRSYLHEVRVFHLDHLENTSLPPFPRLVP